MTGLSAKSTSLDCAIGRICSLNLREEVIVPSLPLELMKTAAPAEEVWPNTLPIKQLLLTFAPTTPEPIQITLPAVVTLLPAPKPCWRSRCYCFPANERHLLY